LECFFHNNVDTIKQDTATPRVYALYIKKSGGLPIVAPLQIKN
jgi:hypothetical protein